VPGLPASQHAFRDFLTDQCFFIFMYRLPQKTPVINQVIDPAHGLITDPKCLVTFLGPYPGASSKIGLPLRYFDRKKAYLLL
jgi:hypothetical protein